MRVKIRYNCQECGHQSTRWFGRCPGCGAWNSLVEEINQPAGAAATAGTGGQLPLPVTEVPALAEDRFPTELAELDRVLGGGIVPGSLILVGGDPGIGKSTLMLQAAHQLSRRLQVLYVSGEESARQVRLRADRLGALSPGLLLLCETDLDAVESQLRRLAPPVAIIDSIQTMYKAGIPSAPGSVGQVRECAAQLMRLAKTTGISIFLVGHVTKEGTLAGPRVLEHMVDTVLYMEGDRRQFFRVLRGMKNRFGSTHEIGVFEMSGKGLVEVANPSALFLIQRSRPDVPGSVIVAALEGTRPLLVEIQALVSPTGYGVPRRMTAGVDYNRVALIAAVLEKRMGLNLGSQDLYVNAVGGVKLDEPAVDLAIACALVSSFRDVPVDPVLACAGEVGLTGELRPVTGAEKRIKEAFKMGFSRFLTASRTAVPEPEENPGIFTADTLAGALELALKV
ncbi:MAG: DNA repair protein RadA [Pelotomaculaceae bacterium]|jgi:DNA repair protein RadA/Sms|nr:DNA repair protein RadA [Bacillota bacterium]HHU85790.1 DNA repair protein RadA [Peptococcaceae bacterium]